MDPQEAFDHVTGVLREQLGADLSGEEDRDTLKALLAQGYEVAGSEPTDDGRTYEDAVHELATSLARTSRARLVQQETLDGSTTRAIQPGAVETSLKDICPLWPFC